MVLIITDQKSQWVNRTASFCRQLQKTYSQTSQLVQDRETQPQLLALLICCVPNQALTEKYELRQIEGSNRRLWLLWMFLYQRYSYLTSTFKTCLQWLSNDNRFRYLVAFDICIINICILFQVEDLIGGIQREQYDVMQRRLEFNHFTVFTIILKYSVIELTKMPLG